MVNDSDYGSFDSNCSWDKMEKWSTFEARLRDADAARSCNWIYRNSLDEVMLDFKMNGYDAPYNPDDDSQRRPADDLACLGGSSMYLRQKSWPEPDRTPATPLVRPRWQAVGTDYPRDTRGVSVSPSEQVMRGSCQQPAPAKSEWVPSAAAPEFKPHYTRQTNSLTGGGIPQHLAAELTPEQSRVLTSLPEGVLLTLLRLLQARDLDKTTKAQECRFCKNNGERESYYRSHSLKDAARRVTCPVLRAFVCHRCGASGDSAHTIKYCPFTSPDERILSSAMMRSVRMASGRRRNAPSTYKLNYEAPSMNTDNNYDFAPLHPMWAALEKKLMY